MEKISAFIICKNEETVIGQALESLKWSDEIIVIDGKSTDRTLEICRSYTSKIFQRDWTNFGEQRNFALEKTSHPWVFYLDADEVCSQELIVFFEKFRANGLKGVLPMTKPSPSLHPMALLGEENQNKDLNSQIDLIEVRRIEHFKGRPYYFGATNPSHQWRFFRREGAKFSGDVHEFVVVRGQILRLEAPIYHYPRADLTQMFSKMNRYSTLEAEQLFKKNIVHRAPYMFFSGLAMFTKSYFRKQGFRDGVLGFIFSVMDASGFFLRQAKLYLLNRGAKRI